MYLNGVNETFTFLHHLTSEALKFDMTPILLFTTETKSYNQCISFLSKGDVFLLLHADSFLFGKFRYDSESVTVKTNTETQYSWWINKTVIRTMGLLSHKNHRVDVVRLRIWKTVPWNLLTFVIYIIVRTVNRTLLSHFEFIHWISHIWVTSFYNLLQYR